MKTIAEEPDQTSLTKMKRSISQPLSPKQVSNTRNASLKENESEEKIKKERAKRARILRMVTCTSADLKDFKQRYHVKECISSSRIPKDDNLTLDEKFQKMALASKANFYLHKKHPDIHQRMPF